MTITKLGHCCLVVEITTPTSEDGGTPFSKRDKPTRIMTDPGAFSVRQNEVKDIDFIFITHEHQDHFHLESLNIVLKNNPRARVVTNHGVGKLLAREGIAHEILEHGQTRDFGGISVEGCGEQHAVIFHNFGQVQNTGYLFAGKFFYPGDSFFNPGKPVEILALPVAGPWMKMSEAILYAKLIHPRFAFPVHDGMLNVFGTATVRRISETILTPLTIQFVGIGEGDSHTF